MFAIEIIVQRNAWAKLECTARQLLMQRVNIFQRMPGEIVQRASIMRRAQRLAPREERFGIGANHCLMQRELRIHLRKGGFAMRRR